MVKAQCRTTKATPRHPSYPLNRCGRGWADTVDFHCRRTLSLYNSTRSISVQGDHFHSVYFAAAWLEPPCASHCGVLKLMGLDYRSSHRRPFAIPVGQGELRQHYIARRKSVCIFEESPPSVPINGAVLRIMNK